MNKNVLRFSTVLFVVFLSIPASPAEKISLKLAYKTNTIKTGDLFAWIDSYNLLWNDWQSRQGGVLEGQFDPPDYRSNTEFELRIPIFASLSITLGGGSLMQSQTEGTVHFKNSEGDQEETQFISNKISALPFKFGLNYMFRIPGMNRLSVNIGAARMIIFAAYENSEDYAFQAQFQETEYSYWYKKEGDYRSECLGLCASLTVEYGLFKSLALLAGLEKRWAKMDGFKGPYSYTANFEPPESDISGKASLYFYESGQWGGDNFYSVLSGHINRPEDSNIQNIRQGNINLGGYSFIFGIRLII